MEKMWEEKTTDEKVEHLFYLFTALRCVVNQQQIGNGNVGRRLLDLEAKVAKLSKGLASVPDGDKTTPYAIREHGHISQ